MLVKQDGFTLIEVLVALTILSFALVAGNQMAQHNLYLTEKLQTKLQELALVPIVSLKMEQAIAHGEDSGTIELHGKHWEWHSASRNTAPMLAGADLETGVFNTTSTQITLHKTILKAPSGHEFQGSAIAWEANSSTALQ